MIYTFQVANARLGRLLLKGRKNRPKKLFLSMNVKIDSLHVKEHGIQLVFVASPVWYGKDEDVFAPIKEICNKEEVLVYNYSNDTDFVHNDEMFKDGLHLNDYGADEFTKQLCNKYRHE